MPAVSDKSIAEKLHMKPGKNVLLVNAPAQYEKKLGKIPAGVSVSRDSASATQDIIQVFVASAAALKRELPRLKKSLKSDGALWVTYYKGTSKTKTDINRDSISEYASSIGIEGVAIISIDDDWFALRLKIVS